MSTAASVDPEFLDAVDSCVTALKHVAEFELAPSLNQRLLELGEEKEFLDAKGHDELTALMEFASRRNIEKLEARVALDRLRRFFPDRVDAR